MDLSPASGSNRPTPNSTAPSEARTSYSNPASGSNNGGTNNNNNGGAGRPGSHSSHSRSYETSPAMTHQNLNSTSSQANGAPTAFAFNSGGGGSIHDYSTMTGSGMTPGPFEISDVDVGGVGARDFVVPSWETGGSGMTPGGDGGMLGSLMGVGGMEMGWDGEIGRDR